MAEVRLLVTAVVPTNWEYPANCRALGMPVPLVGKKNAGKKQIYMEMFAEFNFPIGMDDPDAFGIECGRLRDRLAKVLGTKSLNFFIDY